MTDKDNGIREHQPNYLVMVLAVVSALIMLFVAWHLVMGISTHTITGEISEVRYIDNGFAADSVKVFFQNHTGPDSSIEFKFDSKTYYTNDGNRLDSVYQLLKGHVGDQVIIEYTKAPIGDVGFVNLTVIK